MTNIEYIGCEQENMKSRELNEFRIIIPGIKQMIRIRCKNNPKPDWWAYYLLPKGVNVFCFCHGHSLKDLHICNSEHMIPIYLKSGRSSIIYMLEQNMGDGYTWKTKDEIPITCFTPLPLKTICLILIKVLGNAEKIKAKNLLPSTLNYEPYPEKKTYLRGMSSLYGCV
jgi:hypothetical protein